MSRSSMPERESFFSLFKWYCPQGMCLDKGYDYDEVYATLLEFSFTAHVRPRGEEAKAIKRQAGFKARALWWWSGPIRGSTAFAVCWSALEKKPENYLAFLHFGCGLLAFRAAGLFG